MAHIFPALRPTTRQYECPEYAQKRPEYVNTVAYSRLMGSKPGKAKLTLTFENILDDNAALIIGCYINSLSGFFPIDLPDEIIAGIDDEELANKIQTGEHLQWFFNSPPDQTAVMRNISTVKVELIGDISLD